MWQNAPHRRTGTRGMKHLATIIRLTCCGILIFYSFKETGTATAAMLILIVCGLELINVSIDKIRKAISTLAEAIKFMGLK